MDKNRQLKITRAWMALVATAVIALGTSGLAQAQAILYGAAHTGGQPGASTLYRIDLDGTATAVGPIGFNACSGMDFHPTTGILYATCFRPGTVRTVFIKINPDTGVGTEVNPAALGFQFPVTDISFRNSDQALYAYFGSVNSVGTIDIMTGEATALGPSGGVFAGNGIAFSPSDVLFHATEGPLSTLNQTNGAATFVTGLSFQACGSGTDQSPRINAMDFQPGTGILFGSLNIAFGGGGPNCLVTIDTATGEVTLIGLTVPGLDALAWSQAAEVTEHFECYKAEGRKVRETVKLEDQFGIKPRVRVRGPELFCNPVTVSKNDEGIKNQAGHLTCYEIKDGDDDAKRRVRVKNQFGEQTLKVDGAKLLCVASEKLSVVDGKDDDDHDDHGDRDHEKDSKRGRDD